MFYSLYANFVPYYCGTDFFDNLSTDLLETRIGRKNQYDAHENYLFNKVMLHNLCMKINN